MPDVVLIKQTILLVNTTVNIICWSYKKPLNFLNWENFIPVVTKEVTSSHELSLYSLNTVMAE